MSNPIRTCQLSPVGLCSTELTFPSSANRPIMSYPLSNESDRQQTSERNRNQRPDDLRAESAQNQIFVYASLSPALSTPRNALLPAPSERVVHTKKKTVFMKDDVIICHNDQLVSSSTLLRKTVSNHSDRVKSCRRLLANTNLPFPSFIFFPPF